MHARRQLLVLGAAALAAPFAAFGQGIERVARIGYLGYQSRKATQHLLDQFLVGMRERGWTEGKNLLVEYRFADLEAARLPTLAGELVQQKAEVIFAPVTAAALAVKKITSSTPVVFAIAANPVIDGLVANLARPGGNVTGLTQLSVDLAAKRIELLRDAFPKLKRVGVLADLRLEPRQLEVQIAETGRAIAAIGGNLLLHKISRPEEFESAFAALRAERAEALFATEGALFFTHRKRIAELAAGARLPTIFGAREYVEAGGLMSYATNYSALMRRASIYVDKILRGAKPKDLPVEQPTDFELTINAATAKALHINLPKSILMRADRVIE